MAPRAPEDPKHLLERLRKGARKGITQMPFGSPHNHHVLCSEGGVWRVRRWICDPQKGEAYLKEHGYFMPETAEAISEPGPDIVLEAATIDDALALLSKSGLLD